jgi:3-phenylpropionate/cinnamic acid dioxygenase small subunit
MGPLHEGPEVMPMSGARIQPVGNDTFIEIQRFLFREASLLDNRQYADWLGLLDEDIHYRVTARVVRDAGADAADYAIIEEYRVGLKSRIDQISNPRLTRAENPPSLIRRFVSNIEAYPTAAPGEFTTISHVLAYRARRNAPEGGFYVAERQDVLRRNGAGWRLARRLVRLDQSTLLEGALSTIL